MRKYWGYEFYGILLEQLGQLLVYIMLIISYTPCFFLLYLYLLCMFYLHFEQVKHIALVSLLEENNQKSKTKHIQFETLIMRDYLRKNQNTLLSKIIFSVRSGTLDIKLWNDWNYSETLCVMCARVEESIEHFMTCEQYGNEIKIPWTDIFGNDSDKQCLIANEIKNRQLSHFVKKLDGVGPVDNRPSTD